jgi:peptide methionine sulfoxide reductase msrA/msrB
LIKELKKLGHHVVTELLPVKPFWVAEDYHQNYYEKVKKEPYCHVYVKKF